MTARLLLATLALALAASCVPRKATIDYTLTEGIVWPGVPEKPRILYLWSLKRVRGGEGSGTFLRAVAGPEEYAYENPKESEILVRPNSVFVDDRGKLYITDTGALRVLVVDPASMETLQIDNIDGLPFFAPVGVVADRAGRIYVTDANLGVVLVFDAAGKYLGNFRGGFERPTGMAINPEKGLIYISDTWAHKIYIYNLDGRRVGSFGGRGAGPGEFNYPTHIALDKNGYLYVSDTLNFRFQVFTPQGGFVSAFGLIGDTYDTFDKIKGIAVDSEGHIYVTDSGQDMVKIFDKEGRLLLFFGGRGHFYGQFYLPTGMYIDKDNRIFVVDALNQRVQAFRFLGGDGGEGAGR